MSFETLISISTTAIAEFSFGTSAWFFLIIQRNFKCQKRMGDWSFFPSFCMKWSKRKLFFVQSFIQHSHLVYHSWFKKERVNENTFHNISELIDFVIVGIVLLLFIVTNKGSDSTAHDDFDDICKNVCNGGWSKSCFYSFLLFFQITKK